jgi:hypothetical protein
MNDGMKIILERMKTHPEEFKRDNNNLFSASGKWVSLVGVYEDSLPEEDVKAFKDAFNVMRQEEFTAKVMEELLDPKSEQLELDLIPRQPPPRMQQATTTLSVSTSSTSLKELLIEKQKQKPHKTIFGRLFNYT